MLKLANNYKDEIAELMKETWYDDKYKFYHYSNYRREFTLPKGDWDGRHFVSVDSNDNLIGYICYEVCRPSDIVDGFGAINFTNNKTTFGKDLAQIIDDIFCKFNHNKIEFNVVVGNPIERSYDRMVEKYGGRIVGIRQQHTVLIDNIRYDDKIYEILREDYLKAKERIALNKSRPMED